MSRKSKTFTRISIRICAHCGQEYLYPHLNSGRRKYCSSECAKESKDCPSRFDAAERGRLTYLKDKPKTVIRICLKCGQRFSSWGPGNRLCKLCRADNNSLARSYSDVALSGEKWTAI